MLKMNCDKRHQANTSEANVFMQSYIKTTNDDES